MSPSIKSFNLRSSPLFKPSSPSATLFPSTISRLPTSTTRKPHVLLQHAYSSHTTAFCFDIDGVLKQGSTVLPAAKQALAILNGHNPAREKFPFILCTNGGGVSEEQRSQRLSEELGCPITPARLVQSHTIFTQFLDLYRHKPILVIGGASQRCRLIANGYGFNQVYIPQDFLKWNPSVWPFHKLTEREDQITKAVDFDKVAFSAIFVMHDAFDWGLAIQVALDLLTSPDGRISTAKNKPLAETQQMPIYFSNPDVVWANEFPRPRFGQGAFQMALRGIYEQVTGRPLEAWTGGKPSRNTFAFADELLGKIIEEDEGWGNGNEKRVYMVGDNPASDIKGANKYGWSSVLVKTGVFKQEKEEDIENVIKEKDSRPTCVQENVLEAVKWVLKKENGLKILR